MFKIYSVLVWDLTCTNCIVRPILGLLQWGTLKVGRFPLKNHKQPFLRNDTPQCMFSRHRLSFQGPPQLDFLLGADESWQRDESAKPFGCFFDPECFYASTTRIEVFLKRKIGRLPGVGFQVSRWGDSLENLRVFPRAEGGCSFLWYSV